MQILDATFDDVSQLALTADGCHLAVVEKLGTTLRRVSTWDLRQGTRVHSYSDSHRVVAFAAGGETFAIVDRDGTVTVYNTYSFQPDKRTYNLPGSPECLHFTADGSLLLGIFSQGNSARSWSYFGCAYGLATRTVITPKGQYFFGDVRTFAVCPAGRILASAGRSEIELLEFSTTRPLRRWPVNVGAVRMTFSPDGASLATAVHEFVQVWDVETGRQRFTLVGHEADVLAVAFSPDGRLMATGGRDRVVRFWDAADGSPMHTYEWPTGQVHAVAFAPDGLTAAAGGESGAVVVWDL